jgi:hypothetical protein
MVIPVFRISLMVTVAPKIGQDFELFSLIQT